MGVRGTKKHLKRLNAPKHWMLDKLGGIFVRGEKRDAPKPSPGPHKSRECLPLILLLRNRLKYALTGKEVTSIMMQRLIKVDGKVRTDKTYPTGLMDVVEIEKTNEFFRLLYDVKGIPCIITHDGRTVRYPDPLIKANDTVVLDIETGKIKDFVKFDVGNMVIITGGRNRGRAGIMIHREKHKGTFDICHVKDAAGNTFATRMANVLLSKRTGNGTQKQGTSVQQ
eukprot:jgi/Pico_ML_1/55569/g1237.t2